MKFPYFVKHNGIIYKPNEEVPMNESAPVKAKAEPKETIAEVSKVEETPAPANEKAPAVEEPKEKEEPTYTKTEINRMPIFDLRRLARKHGIKKAADKSGAELKAELIDILKL